MSNQSSDTLQTSDAVVCVTGRVPAPVRFTLSDLLEMEPEEFQDLFIVCGTGTPRDTIGSCRGVLLEKVIQKSDVDKGEHNDTKKMFIVAVAADGYKVVFSWQEIFNTPNGGGVALLVERDGKALDRIDLISANDYFAGSRYVKNLQTIEVLLYS